MAKNMVESALGERGVLSVKPRPAVRGCVAQNKVPLLACAVPGMACPPGARGSNL